MDRNTLQQVQLALAAFERKRFDLADKSIRAILEREPTHTWAVVALGVALRAQSRWAEALMQAEHAVALHPNDASAHFSLALSLNSLEQYERSLVHALETIKIDPLRANRYLPLANLYVNTDRYGEAVAVAEKGLAITASFAPLVRQRIVALAGNGQIDDARASLDTLFRNDPGIWSFFCAGWMHWTLGEYEKAVEYLRETLRQNPVSADGLALLGWSLYELGQFTESRDALEESLRLKPYFERSRKILAAINGRESISVGRV